MDERTSLSDDEILTSLPGETRGRLAMSDSDADDQDTDTDDADSDADTETGDSGLGFHVAVLPTAELPPGSRIDFTWRRPDGGAWSGRDASVQILDSR